MVLLRWLWRLVKLAVWLAVIVVLVPVVGLAYGFLTTSSLDGGPPPGGLGAPPPKVLADKVRAEIPGYQRPEESTYLAYPERAIVYAARDYAAYVKASQPSGFPYWAYIGRFWQDYATVIRAGEAYPFDFRRHRMLAVIGTGHTIEHALQWAYENTVGRATEVAAGRRTAADDYLAKAAADYAAFLNQAPWYEFPYAKERSGLFAVQPAPGDGGVRPGERKLAFGLAYTAGQAGADLIRPSLAAGADPALPDIHVWARGPVGAAARNEPDTALERDFGDDGAVFVTRRGQAFTDMIPRLIANGVSFVEIGGNDEIMLTMLSDSAVAPPEGSRQLFSYPLPAAPQTRRTALVVAVRKLDSVLPVLGKAGAKLEHVYDY